MKTTTNNRNRIRKGKSDLLSAVLSGCTVINLIKLGEKIVEVPFVIATGNHFVWYASDNIPNNSIVPQTGATIVSVQNINILFDDNDNAQIVKRTFEQFYYAFCHLNDNGISRGYICAVSQTQFDETTLELIKAFADILTQEMLKADVFKIVAMYSDQEQLILNLIENPKYEYVFQDVKSIFTNNTPYMQLMVIGLNDNEKRMVPEAGLIDRFKEKLNYEIAVGYKNNIVILAPSDKIKNDIGEINHLLVENNLIAGLSSPFYGLSDIRRFYNQGIYALGKCYEKGNIIVDYSNVVFYHILEKSELRSEDISLCNNDIKILYKYDLEKKTNLCVVLYEYIKSGCSATETAKKLGIHRNSVILKIKKIQELISDGCIFIPDTLLSLELLWSLCKDKNPA